MNEKLNDTLMAWVSFFNDPLWDFLVIFLLAVGIFYTIVDQSCADQNVLSQYQSDEGQP